MTDVHAISAVEKYIRDHPEQYANYGRERQTAAKTGGAAVADAIAKLMTPAEQANAVLKSLVDREIDALASAHVAKHGGTHAAAVAKVLEADPSLYARHAAAR